VFLTLALLCDKTSGVVAYILQYRSALGK